MKLEDLFEKKPIFESPQKTFVDFGMDNDSKKNKNVGKEYQKNGIAIEKIGDYTLYETNRGYALLNDETYKTIYAMKFKFDYHKFLNRKCVSQIAVWADLAEQESEGVAKRIFFDHLLYNHETVITDYEQTDSGEAFWKRRIGNALRMPGVYVYYVSFVPNREIIEIKSTAELYKLEKEKEIWGNKQHNAAKRIIITTKPMEETT